MTKKITAAPLLVLFAALLFFPQRGYCAEQTPAQFVCEFYAWYFQADMGESVATENKEIYKYVDKKLMDFVTSPHHYSYSYFTKQENGFLGWGRARCIPHETIAIYDRENGPVYLVPITFEEGQERLHIFVYVKKEGDNFKIIKVSDPYPYS